MNIKGECIIFLQSRTHVSMYKEIEKKIDFKKVYLYRSLPKYFLKEPDINYQKGFIISDPLFILNLFKNVSFDSVVLPQCSNYLFILSMFSKKIKNIYLIEDGWETWFLVNKKNYLDKVWEVKENLFLISLFKFGANNIILNKMLSTNIQKKFFRIFVRIFYFVFGKNLIYKSSKIKGYFTPFSSQINSIPSYKVNITNSIDNELSFTLKEGFSFFLHPRYLNEFNDKLINYLYKIIKNGYLLLIPHPSFWSIKNQEILNKFMVELNIKKIKFSIYKPNERYKFQDIAFELYQRGCRNFFCCDTTIQLTVENYPSFFKGLKIYSISYLIDSKIGILENEFNYKKGIKKY